MVVGAVLGGVGVSGYSRTPTQYHIQTDEGPDRYFSSSNRLFPNNLYSPPRPLPPPPLVRPSRHATLNYPPSPPSLSCSSSFSSSSSSLSSSSSYVLSLPHCTSAPSPQVLS
ncbi:hypothetical protein E2C01_033190 [Portunus trituberculatus]|uniref:Uncharacterized protein n=1 Tax=Portunus trituberculatus TaxID=210409 RepID=A0A5B7F1T2_PORTR|nr:hypothetical protein [Portunus trituberculatus]